MRPHSLSLPLSTAIHIDVRARQSIGAYVRFQVDVNAVFRRHGRSQLYLPVRRSVRPLVLWVPRANLVCNCPDMRMGRSYLLLSDANTFEYKGQADLALNHKSTLLPWMASMHRRMVKFRRKEKRGRCPASGQRKRTISKGKKKRRRGRQRGAKSQNRQSYPDTYYYHQGVYQGDESSDRKPAHRMRDTNYGYYGTK